MGILDFFRNRQQKNENKSLIVKDGSSIMPYTPKKKKIRNIVDFVENAFDNDDFQELTTDYLIGFKNKLGNELFD